MTNKQLQKWIQGQFLNIREDMNRTSVNGEVEWERAPIDYDTELTESQLVGERVPPQEELAYRPLRTFHGSRTSKHEGKKLPNQSGDSPSSQEGSEGI
jgi:hypothetical protein